jgi:hypothetical protein
LFYLIKCSIIKLGNYDDYTIIPDSYTIENITINIDINNDLKSPNDITIYKIYDDLLKTKTKNIVFNFKNYQDLITSTYYIPVSSNANVSDIELYEEYELNMFKRK